MNDQAYWMAVRHIAGLDKRYKLNKTVGWVYVLRNSSFKRPLLKIGETSRPPHIRAAELSSETGVPGDFELVYFVHVQDRYTAEGLVHHQLESYRVSARKEFFKVPLRIVVSELDRVSRQFPLFVREGRSAMILPQVFGETTITCPGCDSKNKGKELAIAVVWKCRKCGAVLSS